MPFDVDQLIDGVLAGDATDQVAFVVQDAIDEVVCYADVESSVAFAGKDVGAVARDHDCWPMGACQWLGDLGRFEIPACAGPPYRPVRRFGGPTYRFDVSAGPTYRRGPTYRSDVSGRSIGMTGLVEMAGAAGVARVLRKAVGARIVNRPLMNNQAAAGIGTVDGSWSILPEAPGVPMSPAP